MGRPVVILCVTPSPAIDRSGRVDRFVPDRVLRPSSLVVLAGGKGVNVARTAHALGALVVTTGFAGGHAGRWLVESLAAEGLNPRFVETGPETRTTYVLADDRGRTLLVYEPAPALAAADRRRLVELLASELVPAADLVAIAGSLPDGLGRSAAAELVRHCELAGRPCLVDLSGPDLRSALEARPSVVKISLEEAIGGRFAARGPSAASDAVQALVAGGAGRAIVTDGPRGAVGHDGERIWEVTVPRVEAVSPVGSGDAFSAGVAIGLAAGRPFEEALAMGAAAGTANTRTLGAGRIRVEDYEAALAAVRVRDRHPSPTGGRRGPA